MYTMKYDWKKEILSGSGTEESPYVYGDNYSICLSTLGAFLSANAGEHYCGMSANAKLEIHFNLEPSQEIKDAIEAHYSAITPESDEAANYCSASAIEERIAELKEGLLMKTWDQTSIAERKIMLGQRPTKQELGL